MQIMDQPLAVACLVERRAWIDVLHSVTYSVIEQDCDLARRGRHRLGLANARREPPVECAQRGVGPSNGYGSKAQERSGPAAATACSDESTLPPEILLLGAKHSQEVKCFALGQAERSSPHSAVSFNER